MYSHVQCPVITHTREHHVISVEQSRAANESVRQLLRARGFVHVFSHVIWARQLADEIYVNESFLRADPSRLAHVAYATALTDQDDPNGTKAYGERPWSTRTLTRIVEGLIKRSVRTYDPDWFARGWPCPLYDEFM